MTALSEERLVVLLREVLRALAREARERDAQDAGAGTVEYLRASSRATPWSSKKSSGRDGCLEWACPHCGKKSIIALKTTIRL